MRIFYDTEFLEDGKTIDPISFGFVAENGDELYRIVPDELTIQRAIKHPWLRENVIPHLPIVVQQDTGAWEWDEKHPDWPCVKPRRQVADDVRQFILSYSDPELWAWYGAYDHVVLMQLWGAMIDKPEGVPMYTNDLRQLVRQLGDPEIPKRPNAESYAHNALMDAWDNSARFEWLIKGHADWPTAEISKTRPASVMRF